MNNINYYIILLSFFINKNMDNNDFINEKYIDGSHDYDENLFRIGNEQKRKCICKIILENGYGTGFLCKIPFGNRNKLLPVLITNNHVIDRNYINSGRDIIFTKENAPDFYYIINLNIPRKSHSDNKIDFTFIEIKHEDNIELNSFLEVDDDIEVLDPNFTYKGKDAYVLHFPLGNKGVLSIGTIESINEEYKISHKCSTDKGSSGCPILNSKTYKVIGIHKASFKNKNENFGILLRHAINIFIEEMKKQKKDFYENYFDGIKTIDIIYRIKNPKEKLKIFGENFVKNNKNICRILIKDYECDLCPFIDINQYNYDNSGAFEIKLDGVNNIINMSEMFHKCNNLSSVPNISQMNTSKVIKMNSLFDGCEILETLPDISCWDIGKVTDIRAMFYNCKNLIKIPDLSCWNTSNVKNMKEMFWSCSKLSFKYLPDITKWDLSKAIDAEQVFDGYEYGKNKNLFEHIACVIYKYATGKNK